MSLFDELFADSLGDSRPESPQSRPAESEQWRGLSPKSPRSPGLSAENVTPLGEAPCPTCGCGSFWRGDSGAWQCEGCNPPGNAHVTIWRNVSGGTLPTTPRPAEPWPADLNPMLNRVSTFYEWSPADRSDFIAWARRSPAGLADARQFLEAEAARLPTPGLSDRSRVVLSMLKADPALRCTWTGTDNGSDPVVLTLAIRGKGTCELAIPRAKFDALDLPGLIAGLSATQEGAA